MKDRSEQIKLCGNCHWHQHDFDYHEWTCANRDSENYADFTEFNYKCECWDKRL